MKSWYTNEQYKKVITHKFLGMLIDFKLMDNNTHVLITHTLIDMDFL